MWHRREPCGGGEAFSGHRKQGGGLLASSVWSESLACWASAWVPYLPAT